MTTLANSLGQAGPGTSQTIGGKTWTLTRSTKNIQAAWGKWYADRVEAAVLATAASYRKQARALWRDVKQYEAEEMADELPTPSRAAELAALIADAQKEASFLEFEARASVERFNDRKGAGEFEFHGNASLNVAMQNLPGQFQLAYLCLQPKHPDVTMEEVMESYKGHAQEWGEFLVRSEGVRSKNGGEAPSASTPASSMTDRTTSTLEPIVPDSGPH